MKASASASAYEFVIRLTDLILNGRNRVAKCKSNRREARRQENRWQFKVSIGVNRENYNENKQIPHGKTFNQRQKTKTTQFS